MVRCLRAARGMFTWVLYAVRTLFARCLYVSGKVKKIDNIYVIISYIKTKKTGGFGIFFPKNRLKSFSNTNR